MKALLGNGSIGNIAGEKIKQEKFGREVGKSVILCQLIQN